MKSIHSGCQPARRTDRSSCSGEREFLIFEEGGRGDLIARVVIGIPTNLTEEQRHLLIALAESLGTPWNEEGKGVLGKIKGALG